MSKNWFWVVFVAIFSLAVFWSPWLLRVERVGSIAFGGAGMETVVQNFDGLNFLIVAKSLYDPTTIEQINTVFPTGNTPNYFAAHYPLFAILIRALEMLMPAPYALLGAIVISNALLALGLYGFFRVVLPKPKLALYLSLIALFWPARMLSVRAVGSNEPLFMFLVLTSLTMATQGKHWLASGLGSLAILTRSPGILLFGAYGLAALASYRLDWK